jgi:crotonobetainyl-CoA:carnitine CoA-transferase CaiB-like acyl-CoA transferase
LSRHRAGPVSAPCQAGEHTRQILAELGYDEPAIARLIDSRTVLASGH